MPQAQSLESPRKSSRSRARIAVACMCAGVLPLLLLDGQFFTHSLLALPFFLAATAVTALSALDSRIADEHKRAWMLATLLPALLAIGLIASLRSSYQAQSGFNNAIRRLHHGSMTRPAR